MKSLICAKRVAYKAAVRERNIRNESFSLSIKVELKRLKAAIKKQLREDRNLYLDSFSIGLRNAARSTNQKAFYNLVNDLTGRGKSSGSGRISSIKDTDGLLTHDKTAIADLFADWFSETMNPNLDPPSQETFASFEKIRI